MSNNQQTKPSIGLAWFKSSYSGTSGGDCVEVAAAHRAVYVRDSKTTSDGPLLRISRDEWSRFVTLVRA